MDRKVIEEAERQECPMFGRCDGFKPRSVSWAHFKYREEKDKKDMED